MSPKEFVTYLNGAVELGNISVLNSDTFAIVNNKVNAVVNENTTEGIFCTWLKGFMEASETQELSASQFAKVSVKLFDVIEAKSVFDKKIDTKVPMTKLPVPNNLDMKARC